MHDSFCFSWFFVLPPPPKIKQLEPHHFMDMFIGHDVLNEGRGDAVKEGANLIKGNELFTKYKKPG